MRASMNRWLRRSPGLRELAAGIPGPSAAGRVVVVTPRPDYNLSFPEPVEGLPL